MLFCWTHLDYFSLGNAANKYFCYYDSLRKFIRHTTGIGIDTTIKKEGYGFNKLRGELKKTHSGCLFKKPD